MANAGLHKRALTTRVLAILNKAGGPVPWTMVDLQLQADGKIKKWKSAKRTMMALLSRGLINMIPGKGLEINDEGKLSYAEATGETVILGKSPYGPPHGFATLSSLIRQNPEWSELPIAVNQGRGFLDTVNDRASVNTMKVGNQLMLVFTGNVQ